MSVNKVIVMGRIGQDPELKYTPSGQAVLTFSVATSEHWVDKDKNKQQRTEWHSVELWGKRAESLNPHLRKGQMIYTEGSLKTDTWEKDNNGTSVKFQKTKIVARDVQFTGESRSESDNKARSKQQTSQPMEISTDSNFTSDDIPF